MTKLTWDASGTRRYETGVDQGVLYIPHNGVYDTGYAWNGLTTVTEAPSGATVTPQYADNAKYLNMVSAEQFGATLDAFTYPSAFEQCDGTADVAPGVTIGQQNRQTFGFSYRTLIGDDVSGTGAGYKLHLVYGCLAAPSQKAHATVNDSPTAVTFSWTVSTTPVSVAGFKPTATLTIDSTKVSPANLATLENALYGTAGTDPRLPLPDEVAAMFAGAITNAVPAAPVYTAGTHTIAVPNTAGVVYRRADTNAVVTNTNIVLAVGQQLVVYAVPAGGYAFAPQTDDDWQFNY